MAEQTVLTMVQNILSRMSSDQVNSIGDSTEATQVAQIIQNKYYDIIARGDLTLDETLFQLNPSDDVTIPIQMTMPEGISKISWLQYFDTNPFDNMQVDQFGSFSHDLNTDLISSINWTTTSTTSFTIPATPSGSVVFTVASSHVPVTIGQLVQATSGTSGLIGNVVTYVGNLLTINITSTIGSGIHNSWVITSTNVPNVPPGYKYVEIVPIDYFLNIVNRFDISQPGTFQYTFNNGTSKFNFRYRNDHQPTMCTVIANFWVLFDMFDNTQDSTLQASKTLAYGQRIPPFLLEDSFVPVLNDNQFPLLLNEATSLAFYELKQMPHAKADQEIKRQWTVTQKGKSLANKPGYFDQLSNFGRVPRTGGYGGYPPNLWMRNSLGNTAAIGA